MTNGLIRTTYPGYIAWIIVSAMTFSPVLVYAGSSSMLSKTGIHQCFYQQDRNELPCPDPVFISSFTSIGDFATKNKAPSKIREATNTRIAWAEYQEYEAGALYSGGDRVTHIGHLYQCRPYPDNNLCGLAPASYEPGTGWSWEEAWVKVK